MEGSISLARGVRSPASRAGILASLSLQHPDMILTGHILKQRCREIWGNDWQHMLTSLLPITRTTAWRWSGKKTGHTKSVKAKLLTAAEEQLRVTAAFVDELREDLGQM